MGLGPHADVDRVFPAVEGADPRAVTSLYDRMLAHVFKSAYGGSVFGTIGAIDMARWDLKAKLAGEPLWRTLGAAEVLRRNTRRPAMMLDVTPEHSNQPGDPTCLM